VSVKDGALVVGDRLRRRRPPRDRAFKRELEAELERMRAFPRTGGLK
jgi:hypothetical protein